MKCNYEFTILGLVILVLLNEPVMSSWGKLKNMKSSSTRSAYTYKPLNISSCLERYVKYAH